MAQRDLELGFFKTFSPSLVCGRIGCLVKVEKLVLFIETTLSKPVDQEWIRFFNSVDLCSSLQLAVLTTPVPILRAMYNKVW